MNRYLTVLCVASLLFAAAVPAWANGIPAYTCVTLAGTANSAPAGNTEGFSLLSNGTVVGTTLHNSMSIYDYAMTWNASGTPTTIGNTGMMAAVWGDGAGQYATGGTGVSSYGAVYIWNGSSFVESSNSNLRSGALLVGMSGNGLLSGYSTSNGPGWAYDLNTSTYYSFGPAYTGPNYANANGWVVGQDGGGSDGFVWKESNSSYSLITGLNNAWFISSNNGYVAGQNQSSTAAVYTPTGTLVGAYWGGRATGVNNNGIVIGDTGTGFSFSTSDVPYGYFPGYGTVPLNDYAPNGVSFNFAQAINDSGDILVWAGSNNLYDGVTNSGWTSYLLVPTPEP